MGGSSHRRAGDDTTQKSEFNIETKKTEGDDKKKRNSIIVRLTLIQSNR